MRAVRRRRRRRRRRRARRAACQHRAAAVSGTAQPGPDALPPRTANGRGAQRRSPTAGATAIRRRSLRRYRRCDGRDVRRGCRATSDARCASSSPRRTRAARPPRRRSQTAVVVGPPPGNTVLPDDLRDAQQGQTLTASNGDLDRRARPRSRTAGATATRAAQLRRYRGRDGLDLAACRRRTSDTRCASSSPPRTRAARQRRRRSQTRWSSAAPAAPANTSPAVDLAARPARADPDRLDRHAGRGARPRSRTVARLRHGRRDAASISRGRRVRRTCVQPVTSANRSASS